jgi:hypothetical protein
VNNFLPTEVLLGNMYASYPVLNDGDTLGCNG